MAIDVQVYVAVEGRRRGAAPYGWLVGTWVPTHPLCNANPDAHLDSLPNNLLGMQLTHSLIHSLACSLTHSLTHSIARLLARSLPCSSLTHSLSYSLTHSLTHSIHSFHNCTGYSSRAMAAELQRYSWPRPHCQRATSSLPHCSAPSTFP